MQIVCPGESSTIHNRILPNNKRKLDIARILRETCNARILIDTYNARILRDMCNARILQNFAMPESSKPPGAPQASREAILASREAGGPNLASREAILASREA